MKSYSHRVTLSSSKEIWRTTIQGVRVSLYSCQHALSIHHTLMTLGCISYTFEAPLRQKIITFVKSTVNVQLIMKPQYGLKTWSVEEQSHRDSSLFFCRSASRINWKTGRLLTKQSKPSYERNVEVQVVWGSLYVIGPYPGMSVKNNFLFLIFIIIVFSCWILSFIHVLPQ